MPNLDSSLKDKKILLAITGGIAAYKSADLCRKFVKAGALVRVVMTQGACEFITPLTLQAVSGNPVHTELLDPNAELGMGHIELAKWPDLIVVAPATANFIAQYSQGLAQDLLGTLLLATGAPVAVVPAMNQAMWSHPLTQRNLHDLQAGMRDMICVWGPGQGEQACGDTGFGRMLEPEEILAETLAFFATDHEALLVGRRVVITAGPTRESIDPVRFLSNHSSGKMGYALAQACQKLGADVILVSGPVSIDVPDGVTRVSVSSATEMLEACEKAVQQGCDIFIGSAAVADYRPKAVAEQKMKKQGDSGLNIELVQNPDIIAEIARHANRPYMVGFAAETQDVIAYAKGKLERKGLDMVIANDVSRTDIGFNSDQNEVIMVTASGQQGLPLLSKAELADQIVREIVVKLKR